VQWPVGLKNVGQTCWFSAVIQSLFHLPAFRYLVLHFQPLQVGRSYRFLRNILGKWILYDLFKIRLVLDPTFSVLDTTQNLGYALDYSVCHVF
jgi:hypothetical protein